MPENVVWNHVIHSDSQDQRLWHLLLANPDKVHRVPEHFFPQDPSSCRTSFPNQTWAGQCWRPSRDQWPLSHPRCHILCLAFRHFFDNYMYIDLFCWWHVSNLQHTVRVLKCLRETITEEEEEAYDDDDDDDDTGNDDELWADVMMMMMVMMMNCEMMWWWWWW